MPQCDLHFGDSTAHATVEWFLSKLSSLSEDVCKSKNLDGEQFAQMLSSVGLSEDLCKDLNAVLFIDCLRQQVKGRSDHFQSIESIAEKLEEGKKWREFPNLSVLLLSIAQTSLNSQEKPEDTSFFHIGESLYEKFKEFSNSDPDVPLIFKAGFQLSRYIKDDDWKREFAEFKYLHYKELGRLRMEYYSVVDNPAEFSRRVVKRWIGDRWNQINCFKTQESHELKGVKNLVDPQIEEFHTPKEFFQEFHKSELFKKLEKTQLVEFFQEFHKSELFKKLEKTQLVEFQKIEEFYKLEKFFEQLNPLRLKLPILARSTGALKFANRIVKELENDENNSNKSIAEELAKKFRIIQWEILVRDLVEEDRESKLRFYPYTTTHSISGIPEPSFLIDFINKAREIECSFFPSYGEIPTKKHPDNLSTEGFILDKTTEDEVKKCHKSFKDLLRKIPISYPFVHKDLVNSFANMRQFPDKFSNVMLIEDGEFSFFSLLWLLRYGAAVKENLLEYWKSDPEEEQKPDPTQKLKVRFRFGYNDSADEDEWWLLSNMYEFAEECGLIILLPDQKCIPTPRWLSLIAWLKRLNANLMKDKEHLEDANRGKKLDHNNPLLQRLPVKPIKYEKEDEISFIENLWEFLASKHLKDILGELDVLPDISMSSGGFDEKLGTLVKFLDDHSLLRASSVGLEDVLLRCCWGFIPLEHLFRAYHPYELHLLLQALNWEKSDRVDGNQAPISLGGATIAGRIELPQNSTSDSESSEDVTSAFDHWLVPYRSLFSALSADISLPKVKESSEQIGKQTGTQKQKRSFAHQTSGLIGTIWLDPQTKELSFISRFSLWLAKVHVQEIWGDVPMHPERVIYERDFPGWERDALKIVTRLVNLGVWGGIVRAAAPPISDNLEKSTRGDRPDRRNLNRYARNRHLILEDPDSGIERIDQVIKKECDSLSFPHLSEHSPPPRWVTGRAFAICFYHGMRQAAYHALKTFVLIDKEQQNPEKPCLRTEWTDERVLIYNRGEVDIEEPPPGFISNDREFFNRFENKAVTKTGAKMFKIVGPKPVDTGEWCLEINKLVSDE